MDRQGYTLIEMIIAMALSAMALAGILSVATSMLRFNLLGAARGDVTGWALVSLNQMNKEIENATYLTFPNSSTMSGCSNYTKITPAPPWGNKLDASQGVTAFYYCAYTDGNGVQSLLRYEDTSGACPIAATPTCGSTAGYKVIAKSFWARDPATAIFQVSPAAANAVEMHYIVGVATPTAANPTPQVLRIDTTLRRNTAYTNTAD